jgi:archaeal type IV pilus assembly protein PilA
MNFKKINKFRRNVRAISPVIATLLMIAIAVVASLVTYAWVMGYMSFTTNKTGLAIQIQSVSADGHVYVQNVGTGAVSFENPCVYIDGASHDVTSTVSLTNVGAGDTVPFTITGYTFVPGTHSYTIKVTSTDGTFSQIDKIFPP